MSKNGWLRGKSIIELLWDDLDTTMDILMDECTGCGKLAGAHPRQEGRQYCNVPELADYDLEYSIQEYKGRAQGVAYALALMMNPYLRDVDEVRKKAKERWQQREAGEPVTPLQTRPDFNVSDLA